MESCTSTTEKVLPAVWQVHHYEQDAETFRQTYIKEPAAFADSSGDTSTPRYRLSAFFQSYCQASPKIPQGKGFLFHPVQTGRLFPEWQRPDNKQHQETLQVLIEPSVCRKGQDPHRQAKPHRRVLHRHGARPVPSIHRKVT